MLSSTQTQMVVFVLYIFVIFGCNKIERNDDTQLSFLESSEDLIVAKANNYNLQFSEDQIFIKGQGNADWTMGIQKPVKPNKEVDPTGSITELTYQDAFPGIDFRFYNKGNKNAGYDLIVVPDAAVEAIKIPLENERNSDLRPFIDENGELVLPTQEGEIRHTAPVAYQEIDGQRTSVDSKFTLKDQTLGFELSKYDRNYPVVIDPMIYDPAAFMPTVQLTIFQSVSPTNPATGTTITYTISYSAISSVDNPDNPKIIFPLPLAEGVIASALGTDVVATQTLPNGTFEVTLGESFLSGSTRTVAIELIIPPNTICDGTELDLSASISADNAETVNANSTEITVSDIPPVWSLQINQVELGLPGTSNAKFEVELIPITSGVDNLSNVEITIDLPTDMGISYPNICSGCTVSGNELTFSASEYTAGDKFSFELAFDAGFSDMYTVIGAFSSQYGPASELCGDNISNSFSGDFDFIPDLEVVCVDMNGQSPTLSNYIIGEDGVLTFKFQNNSNINLSDLTATLEIPSEIRVTEIPAISFPPAFGNVSYTINYTTFDGNSGTFPSSSSFNTTTGNTVQAIPGLDSDEGLATVTFIFDGTIAPGFMPSGNIAFDYIVQENDLSTGNPVDGANPRIDGSESCLVCSEDNNTNFTCITASLDLEGNSDDFPDLSPVTGGCSTSNVARTPVEGPTGLIKTVDGDLTYFPGQTATFLLNFQVCGDDPLTTAVITDDLPEGFKFDASSVILSNFPAAASAVPSVTGDAAQGAGGQTLEWTFGNLPADSDCNEVYTIEYTATVIERATAADNLSNCFRLDGQIDGEGIFTCSSEELEACVDNLRIPAVGPRPVRKTVDRRVKFPGEEVTFELVWRIDGLETITTMEVADMLPPELEFITGSVEFSDNLFENGDGTGTPLGTFGQDAMNPQLLSGTFNGLEGADPTSLDFVITFKARVRTDVTVTDLPKDIENCFTINNVEGDNVRADYPLERCVDLELRPPGIIALQKADLNSSQLLPKDEFQYRIRFRVAGPYALQNVVLQDQLPEDIEFLGVASYSNNIPAATDPLTVTENMGITTLVWNFADLPGASGSSVNTGFYTIVLNVRVRPGTPVGDIQNCALIQDGDMAIKVDIAGTDFDISDFISDETFSVENCTTVNIKKAASADSRKAVKGECDEEFLFRDPEVEDSGIGSTFSGGAFTYRIEIINSGNVTLNDMVVADILPYLDDDGVLALQERESQWQPVFAGELMPLIATESGRSPATLKDAFYSFETDPCPNFFFDDDDDPLTAPGCTGPTFYNASAASPAFTDVLPEVRTQIRTLRVDFDQPLEPRDTFIIFIEMQAPIGTTAADGIAWNNFAFQADPESDGLFLPAAEPIKVGIKVKDNPENKASLGNFVWLDENGNSLQDPGEEGVNEVRVRLFEKIGVKDTDPGNDATDPDVLVGTRFTANDVMGEPGYYLFSDLEPGVEYYVVFDVFPPNVEIVTPNVGINDAIDSDGNMMGMTDIYVLVAGEENLTVDLGLDPKPNCGFTDPQVRVVCITNDPTDPTDDQYRVFVRLDEQGTTDVGDTYFVITRQEGSPIDVLDNDLGIEYGVEVELTATGSGPYNVLRADGSLNNLSLDFQAETQRLCSIDDLIVMPPATLSLTNVNLTDCILDEVDGEIKYDLTVSLNVGIGMVPNNSEVLVEIIDNGSTVAAMPFSVTSGGSRNVTFEGLICNGENDLTVTATFIDAVTGEPIDEACAAESLPYDEPCYIDIDVEQLEITDNCRDNGTYDITVRGTIFNQGEITVTIDDEELNLTDGSLLTPGNTEGEDQIIFTQTGIECDGRPHTITVRTEEGCEDAIDFEGPRDRDYGDLPESVLEGVSYQFNTTNNNNGAYHSIFNDIFLGDCVDSEIDGAPDFDAGQDDDGDDNMNFNNPDESAFAECDEDDEDGIRLLTPMVAGNEACIEVVATVPDGGANLNAWIDFNGNGQFNPSFEAIEFTSRTNSSNMTTAVNSLNGEIPESGTYIFCFDVPTLTEIGGPLFPDLRTHLRFRLSSQGGLSFNGPANDGEIEDYFTEFAKLGDFVFLDVNKNGLQEVVEEGIPGVEVTLTRVADDLKFTTTTDASGMYMFSGLTPGEEYKVTFEKPEGFTPTTAETGIGDGDADNDSDADPNNGMTGTIVLEEGAFNQDVDAGFFRFDFGDLPDDYLTTEQEGGPRHAIRINQELFLGDGVDSELDGTPDADALGDDNSGDDEDGVDIPNMLFDGQQVTFTVEATNNSGRDAFVFAFFDYNGDFEFEDDEIQFKALTNGSEDAPLVFTFDIPAGSDTDKPVGVRFRIGTDRNEVELANGNASDGEVEDYLVEIKAVDYGDLPDLAEGSATGDYETLLDNGGAAHGIPSTPNLFIGNLIDGETGTLQNTDADADDNDNTLDEDGVTFPDIILSDTKINIDVVVTDNIGGSPSPTLVAYIDWNQNGVFEMGNEIVSQTIDNGSDTYTLMFMVPADAAENVDLGARFRLVEDLDELNAIEASEGLGNGFVMNGEVEDYIIQVNSFDLGDAGENFPTTIAEDGARHVVPSEPKVFLGETVDVDVDGQPDDDAEGDDNMGDPDDEDGIEFVDMEGNETMLITCEPTTIQITGNLPDGETGFLNAWIDYEDDGDWEDADEQIALNVEINGTTAAFNGNSFTYFYTFDVPCDATVTEKTFLRFRFSTEQDLGVTGMAMDGEVEDYVREVKGLDFGDLPEDDTNYPTTRNNNGARHVVPVDPQLFLGEDVDTDQMGAPTEMADGDDNEGSDEDGIEFITPLVPGFEACIRVDAVNNLGEDAKLFAYADFDGDGNLEAIEFLEVAGVDANGNPIIPAGGLQDADFCFIVPEYDAAANGMTYFRFRLSTDEEAASSEEGLAMDGEVEDYKRQSGKVGNVVWFDRDNDGVQDTDEASYGIEGVMLELTFTDINGEERTFTTTTDENGEYYFCGLIPGEYELTVMNPDMFTPTAFNINEALEEDRDSDGIPFENGEEKVSTVFEILDPADQPTNEEGIEDQNLVDNVLTNIVDGFPDNQVNQQFDFGYIGADYGDAGENFPTEFEDDGARHLKLPGRPTLSLGEMPDLETEGQPDDEAEGDDSTEDPDDEDGIEFVDAQGNPTMLIACEQTQIQVTTNLSAEVTEAYLQAWIDFNDDGDWEDAGEKVADNFAITESGTVFLTVDVPCDAVVTDKTFLRFRLSTEDNLGFTGEAIDGEVEDYVQEIKGLDFGDLAMTDDTQTQLPDGARHVIPFEPELFLGSQVDTEQNGNASPMAMGDDEDGVDDEDGIEFITPLVKDEQACIRVDAVNNLGEDATLYGFADFDGDGALEPIPFTGGNPIIENGGVTDVDYCFVVPSNFNDEASNGRINFRFRLSTDPAAASPSDLAMDGEVEDYQRKLAKVGNVVWFDRDFDGIQDNSEREYGLADIDLQLSFTGIDGVERTYTATTDENGEYYFCGLIEGDYSIMLQNPNMTIPTMPNAGTEDDKDSDGEPVVGEETTKTMANFTIEDVLDNPTDEEGIEDQEIVKGFPTNDVNGYVDNQVDQTIDFGFVSADFGDLPETYGTLLADNGPRHTVPNGLVPEIPELFLGDGVDIDLDGQIDPMNMSLGDDENDGNDDEDGVELIKPLIPGFESCVRVKTTIPSGSIGYLNAWIDLNANGVMDDGDHVIDDELLVTGENVFTEICFDVPADAEFVEGLAFARFRLSTVGGLSPVGGAPDGEVEDYKFPLGKLGNLVWEDFDFDGIQDEEEPGIEGVQVSLTWEGTDGVIGNDDDETYQTTTDENGLYYFCGLINGDYKIKVFSPEDMTPTRFNIGDDDDRDSDGIITDMDLTMVMTDIINVANVEELITGEDGNEDQGIVNGFPDNQVDETYDFGFAGLDYGDLPEEEQGENFSTTMENNGPIHVIQPSLRLGVCVDAERDGNPDDDAGQFDGKDGDNDLGDDGTQSEFIRPEGTECTDDENGIEFVTPLIPDNEACIRVTYTAPAEGAVLQGWIDFNGDGILNDNEALELTDAGILLGAVNNVLDLCFTVPEDAIFNEGVAYARFRLSKDGGLSPSGPDKFDQAVTVPGGEVEDYRVKLAKVGNLVWEDRNNNGLQDEAEIQLGLNEVNITLVFGGIDENGNLDPVGPNGTVEDRTYATVTATREYEDGSMLDGLYYYCGLIEGSYEIIVDDPKDLTPTRPNNISNVNDEDKDSDGIVVDGKLKVKVAFTLEDQMKLMNLVQGEEGTGDQDLDNLIDPNMVGTFSDNQVDQRFDFGYTAFDFGDLPNESIADNFQYNTTIDDNGAKHIVTPDLFLGECVDGEIEGAPDAEAGYKGNGNNNGDDAIDEGIYPDSWKQPMDIAADCKDDENGVEFITPLIPGYEACIELDFNVIDNFDGPDAFLNAWVDYNGNGVLDEEEKIIFKSLNDQPAELEELTDALILENSDKQDRSPLKLCFDVPEEAKYLDGMAYFRFRISFDPRLGPDGLLSGGIVPLGEVEDYKVPLVKVGNLVWDDINFNGIQDKDLEDGLGINDVPVALIFSGQDGTIETTDILDPQGDDRVYYDTTKTLDDVAGLYYFCGLIENNTYDYNYKIVVESPEDMTPTRPDRGGDDVVDSDGEDGVIDGAVDFETTNGFGMVMTRFELPSGTADDQPEDENGIGDDHGTAPDVVMFFPDQNVNQTFDFGFAGLDYGDLPDDPENPNDFNTFMDSEGPIHATFPMSFLGTCVDAERDADPNFNAIGDDDFDSAFSRPEDCEDDEDGVVLTSPLIPGEVVSFKVTYSWMATETAYLNMWFDLNENGTMEEEERVKIYPYALPVHEVFNIPPIINYPLPSGKDQMVELMFIVPADAPVNGGGIHARFRISDQVDPGVDGPEKYGTAPVPFGEVEDYRFPLSKIGNLVWEDANLDGFQDGPMADTAEVGFEDLEVTLVFAGFEDDVFGDDNDRIYTTKTNEEGLYYFCGLIPGKYQIFLEKFVECVDGYEDLEPVRYILTIPNNVDGEKGDQFDSDADPIIEVMLPDPMDLIRGEMGVGDMPGMVQGYPDSLDDFTYDIGLIREPNLEALLNDVGFDYPQSFECGNINVTLDLCIENTGEVPLEQLQAMLDLSADFGTSFETLVGVEVVNGDAVQMAPSLNEAYDGVSDINLLTGMDGLLFPNDSLCLRITLEIDPDAAGAFDPILTQASVSGKAANYQGQAIPDWCNGGNQFMAMDLSNDGQKIQGGYDDDDNPTAISDCWKDVDLIAQNDLVYVTVDEDCKIMITPDMVLEGAQERCSDEAFPEGGFYRIRFGDEEASDFIMIDVAEYNVGEPFEIEVRTVSNFCEPVWGFVVPEDKSAARIPEVNGELMLTCGDEARLQEAFTEDITRDKDDCSLSGLSWDLLREAGVFDIDALTDGCFNSCHLDIKVSDLYMPGGDVCDGTMMIRTIRVVDEKGNVSSVEIPFIFKPIDLVLDEIMKDTTLDLCAHPDATSNDLLLKTGVPYYINGFGERVNIDEAFLNTENKANLCNVSLSYEDQILPDNCTEKIIRTWTILDWCKSNAPIVKTQEIKWGQFSAPAVSCSEHFPDTVSSGPFDCKASFIVPAPDVAGCVNDEFIYQIKVYREQIKRDPTGLPIEPRTLDTVIYAANIVRQPDGLFQVGGLEHGNYFIGYTVKDACDNVAEEILCRFVVADQNEPVAACNDELNISIDGTGIAHITVEDVDEGSWDNCELVDLRIRRSLDSCADAYLNEVLGIASVEELHEIETTDDLGNPLFYYFSVEDGKDTLLMREVGKDGNLHLFTYWAYETWFTCCDLSKSEMDFVTIELRAEDQAGNVNICWMDNLIENKITPTCIAPDDLTFNCWDFTIDGSDIAQVRAEFGTVEELLESKALQVDFNCNFTVVDTIEFNAGECSEGELKRIFTVIAENGMTSECVQTIKIEKENDYLIVFPADAEDECRGDGGVGIETKSYTCDIFAIEADTAIYEASGDECFKRYVTYRVINWCEYDGITLEPTVVPRDVDCDGNTFEPTYVKSSEGAVWIDDDASIDVKGAISDDEEFVLSFPATADQFPATSCNDKVSHYTPGFWEYTQVIKVYDDEAPIVSIDTLEFCAFGPTGADNCNGEVMIPFTASDICTESVEIREVQLAVDGQNPVNLESDLYTVDQVAADSFQISSIPGVGLPVGSHFFVVKVVDLCGNIATREIPFTVVDCKTPAPICISILSVDLMPIVENKQVVGGMNTVWATDFIASDIFDCTPHPNADRQGDVRYYAVRKDQVQADGLEVPDSRYIDEAFRNVVFTCEDNGAAIEVFVIGVDSAGNFDFCTVMTNVVPGVDPSPCSDDASTVAGVAGLIRTMEDEMVEGVSVALSGTLDAQMTTDLDGGFAFLGLEQGRDYSITPQLDDNPMNGVSTFDLVLITKHILGLETFDDAYKHIAADVNRSGSITTLDLIQLRKLVLSVDDHFKNNTSWRFIDANYEFADSNNPFGEDFPEIVNINNLDGMVEGVDFIAVKVGDVNLNATANSLMVDERNMTGVFEIAVEDQPITAGNTYEVTLTGQQLAQLAGYQFTLSFDTEMLSLQDISYGLSSKEHVGLRHVEEGMITTSWNVMGNEKAATDELFTLTFSANKAGNLSEAIGISSRYTQAEAYSGQGELKEVVLVFSSGVVAGVNYELYQNVPNPFRTSTMIGFYLPQEGQAELIIRDNKGSVINYIKGDYARGYNQIRVDRKNLPTGVLYYTLKSGDYTATKRMIIVE